jgi:3-oxoadipate enol-lactonase
MSFSRVHARIAHADARRSEQTVELDGLALAVARCEPAPAAENPPRLLLVHGFTGAKEDFTDWLEPLADLGWEAAAVDLRGHGASAKPSGVDDYRLDVMAADVVAVADALGWDRFALLGHSMGGMVAQIVATTRPERLTGLVLMNTGHGPVEGIERRLADLACAVIDAGGMPALVEAMAALPLDDGRPLETPSQLRVLAERPGHAEFNTRKLLAVEPACYRALAFEMFEQADRLEQLRRLALPVLVIVGEEDRPFLGASRRLADAIPGAILEVVPDAGHSPQFENPEAWWGALQRFLKEIA